MDILATNFSGRGQDGIDGLVYFTVNMPVSLPNVPSEHLLWMPSYDVNAPAELVNFVDDLGAEWWTFYQREVGQEAVERTVVPSASPTVESFIDSMTLLREYRNNKPKK
jgi:hypothetical protein